jgi:hypothetical protein
VKTTRDIGSPRSSSNFWCLKLVGQAARRIGLQNPAGIGDLAVEREREG